MNFTQFEGEWVVTITMDKFLITKLFVYLMPNARKRTRYLIRHGVFSSVGNNFVFFPRKIPQDPKLIKFGNNVVVATEVMFVNHDIIHEMLNNLPQKIGGVVNIKSIGIV